MSFRKKLPYIVPLLALYFCIRPMLGYSMRPLRARRVYRHTTEEVVFANGVRHENHSGHGGHTLHHDALFGPHDPNRFYDTDEKKYFQVGVVDFERVKTPFIIGSWILAASLAKIGFHMFPRLSTMFPESCLLIVLGVVVGTVLYFGGLGDVEAAHHLDPDTFFLFMLPPIILDAGYFMPSRLFFDNLGTILVFAVIGTIFNTFAIGTSLYCVGLTGAYGVSVPVLNMFVFASLVSAVDPVAVLAVFEEIHVNEVLYIVVFGESLLNDAVTVVLYHMFEAYVEMGEGNITALDVAAGLFKFLLVAFGGVLVGVVWGFLTAFVTRFTSRVRVIEPLFIFVMAYLSYLNAEIFHLSGILAITFCGLTMKNYVISNVSLKSHTTIKYTMKMLSSSSETVIFMLLGVATVHNHHEWNTLFVVCTIVFCTLFRCLGVLVLSAIVNQFRLDKIVTVDKFVMAYGGLRGAVAFALVLLIDPHHVPQQQMFLTTTIAVIYFTVFVQGISVGPLVEKLGVKKSQKRELTMNERIHERSLDHIMAGVEDIMGHPGRHYVRNMFKHISHTYLRPLLTHQHTSRDPKIMETYSRLAMKDAMKTAVDDVINGPGVRSCSSTNHMASNESWADIRRDPDSASQWKLNQQSDVEIAPKRRDESEATIQRILGDSLPGYRRRRWSYSRHAVRDEDMHTNLHVYQHQLPLFERQRIIDMYRKQKRHPVNGSRPTMPVIKSSPDHVDSCNNSTDFKNVEFVVKSSRESPVMAHPEGFAAEEHGFTEVESVLPWKRDDEKDVCHRPLKWHNTSAPAWIANDNYSSFVSPPASVIVEEDPSKKSTPRNISNGKNTRSQSLMNSLATLRNSFQRRHRNGTISSSTESDTTKQPHTNHTATPQQPNNNHATTTPQPYNSHTPTTPQPYNNHSSTTPQPAQTNGHMTPSRAIRMKSGLDVCADIEGGYVNFSAMPDEDENDANIMYRTRV